MSKAIPTGQAVLTRPLSDVALQGPIAQGSLYTKESLDAGIIFYKGFDNKEYRIAVEDKNYRYIYKPSTALAIADWADDSSQTITIASGLDYIATDRINISYDQENYWLAEVTAYNSDTGSITFKITEGVDDGDAGSYSIWTIDLYNPSVQNDNVLNVKTVKGSYTALSTDTLSFTPTDGDFALVSKPEGDEYNPGWLTGDYYPAGLYIYNGTDDEWEHLSEELTEGIYTAISNQPAVQVINSTNKTVVVGAYAYVPNDSGDKLYFNSGTTDKTNVTVSTDFTASGWTEVDLGDDALTISNAGTALTGITGINTKGAIKATKNSSNADIELVDDAIYVEKYINSYTGESGTTSATDGYVLTANGTGGVAWESVSAASVTKSAVDTAIGASSSGSATKFYNEQGSFVTAGGGGGLDKYSDSDTYTQDDVVWFDDDDKIYVWTSSTDSTAGTSPSDDTTNWQELGGGSGTFNGGTVENDTTFEGLTTFEDTITIDRTDAGLLDIKGDNGTRTAVTSRIRGMRQDTVSWAIEGYQVSGSDNNDARVIFKGRSDNSESEFLRFDPSDNPILHGNTNRANAVIDIKNIDDKDDFNLVIDKTGLNIESNESIGYNFYNPASGVDPATLTSYFHPTEIFMEHGDNLTNKNAILFTGRNNSTATGEKDLLRIRAQGNSSVAGLDNTFSDIIMKGNTSGTAGVQIRVADTANNDDINDDDKVITFNNDSVVVSYNGVDENIIAEGSYTNVVTVGSIKASDDITAPAQSYTVTKYGAGSDGLYVVSDFDNGNDVQIEYSGTLSEDGTTIPSDILNDGKYTLNTDTITGLNQGNASRSTSSQTISVVQYKIGDNYYYRAFGYAVGYSKPDETIVSYTGTNTENDTTVPSDVLTDGKYVKTDTKNY